MDIKEQKEDIILSHSPFIVGSMELPEEVPTPVPTTDELTLKAIKGAASGTSVTPMRDLVATLKSLLQTLRTGAFNEAKSFYEFKLLLLTKYKFKPILLTDPTGALKFIGLKVHFKIFDISIPSESTELNDIYTRIERFEVEEKSGLTIYETTTTITDAGKCFIYLKYGAFNPAHCAATYVDYFETLLKNMEVPSNV